MCTQRLPGSGDLYQTYYSGGWSTNTITTTASASPTTQFVAWPTWGGSTYGQNVVGVDDGTAGKYTWWSYSGSWANLSPFLPRTTERPAVQLPTHIATALRQTTAASSYVGTDQYIYWQAEGTSSAVQLTSGTNRAGDVSRIYFNVTNIAGFYDGTTLHVFYPGQDGYIYELYIAGSSITDSTPSPAWNYHQIGGGGTAANH